MAKQRGWNERCEFSQSVKVKAAGFQVVSYNGVRDGSVESSALDGWFVLSRDFPCKLPFLLFSQFFTYWYFHSCTLEFLFCILVSTRFATIWATCCPCGFTELCSCCLHFEWLWVVLLPKADSKGGYSHFMVRPACWQKYRIHCCASAEGKHSSGMAKLISWRQQHNRGDHWGSLQAFWEQGSWRNSVVQLGKLGESLEMSRVVYESLWVMASMNFVWKVCRLQALCEDFVLLHALEHWIHSFKTLQRDLSLT